MGPFGPGEVGCSQSTRQPSVDTGQGLWDPFSLPTSTPASWQAVAGEVRLDEVELSENEAVLEGEMRLY